MCMQCFIFFHLLMASSVSPSKNKDDNNINRISFVDLIVSVRDTVGGYNLAMLTNRYNEHYEVIYKFFFQVESLESRIAEICPKVSYERYKGDIWCFNQDSENAIFGLSKHINYVCTSLENIFESESLLLPEGLLPFCYFAGGWTTIERRNSSIYRYFSTMVLSELSVLFNNFGKGTTAESQYLQSLVERINNITTSFKRLYNFSILLKEHQFMYTLAHREISNMTGESTIAALPNSSKDHQLIVSLLISRVRKDSLIYEQKSQGLVFGNPISGSSPSGIQEKANQEKILASFGAHPLKILDEHINFISSSSRFISKSLSAVLAHAEPIILRAKKFCEDNTVGDRRLISKHHAAWTDLIESLKLVVRAADSKTIIDLPQRSVHGVISTDIKSYTLKNDNLRPAQIHAQLTLDGPTTQTDAKILSDKIQQLNQSTLQNKTGPTPYSNVAKGGIADDDDTNGDRALPGIITLESMIAEGDRERRKSMAANSGMAGTVGGLNRLSLSHAQHRRRSTVGSSLALSQMSRMSIGLQRDGNDEGIMVRRNTFLASLRGAVMGGRNMADLLGDEAVYVVRSIFDGESGYDGKGKLAICYDRIPETSTSPVEARKELLPTLQNVFMNAHLQVCHRLPAASLNTLTPIWGSPEMPMHLPLFPWNHPDERCISLSVVSSAKIHNANIMPLWVCRSGEIDVAERDTSVLAAKTNTSNV